MDCYLFKFILLISTYLILHSMNWAHNNNNIIGVVIY